MAIWGLTDETREFNGVEHRRVRAVKTFKNMHLGIVEKGTLGGWVEDGVNIGANAWVGEHARVSGNARVWDHATLTGVARVVGDAFITGDARVGGNAVVRERARVMDGAHVHGSAVVRGDAELNGRAEVYGGATIRDSAYLSGHAKVFGDAMVCGFAVVGGDAEVCGFARLSGRTAVGGSATVVDDGDYIYATVRGSDTFHATFARAREGEHMLRVGCWKGNIADFEAMIRSDKWVQANHEAREKHRPEMLGFIEMCRARAATWQ